VHKFLHTVAYTDCHIHSTSLQGEGICTVTLSSPMPIYSCERIKQYTVSLPSITFFMLSLKYFKKWLQYEYRASANENDHFKLRDSANVLHEKSNHFLSQECLPSVPKALHDSSHKPTELFLAEAEQILPHIQVEGQGGITHYCQDQYKSSMHACDINRSLVQGLNTQVTEFPNYNAGCGLRIGTAASMQGWEQSSKLCILST
jgi:hypothetical protein